MNIKNLLVIIVFVAGLYYLYNLVVNSLTYAGQQGRFLIQVFLAVLSLMILNELSKSF
jgi:hypothetical protein